ncbi:MAG: redoxin domain-containing protein [Pirellulaceae bacterium]
MIVMFSIRPHPLVMLLAGLICLVGCTTPTLPGDYGPSVKFVDDAQSNATADPAQLIAIPLTRPDGSLTNLSELSAQKPVVLVISRGLIGSATLDDAGGYGKQFCSFCSTQTSRLIANYSEFKKRGAEVIVVFPVARQTDAAEIQNFAAKVQGPDQTTEDFPFPIVLDVGLAAVEALGIRDDLSKPSTYILDQNGQLRFAYIGKSISDRPSIKALLNQLDQIDTTD